MRTNEEQREALDRAKHGRSLSNYPQILAGFTARGISESDILPRVNVFTYAAWKALGRQVRKGERGVKVVTWITCQSRANESSEQRTYTRPRTVTVFHVSQTVEAESHT